MSKNVTTEDLAMATVGVMPLIESHAAMLAIRRDHEATIARLTEERDRAVEATRAEMRGEIERLEKWLGQALDAQDKARVDLTTLYDALDIAPDPARAVAQIAQFRSERDQAREELAAARAGRGPLPPIAWDAPVDEALMQVVSERLDNARPWSPACKAAVDLAEIGATDCERRSFDLGRFYGLAEAGR